MNVKHRKSWLNIIIASCLGTIALPSLAQNPNPASNPVPNTRSVEAPVAPTQSGFLCDTSGEVPTTMYRSSQGDSEPWIKWASNHFSGSGWSPDARCQEVSDRLETYRKNKKLRYITLGTENNQSVICVATKDQGPCEGIIYTLKPGQDGIQAINNLFAWRKGEQGLESNYESVTAIPYIDVGTRLDEAKTIVPPENLEEESAPKGKPTGNKNNSKALTPIPHRDL